MDERSLNMLMPAEAPCYIRRDYKARMFVKFTILASIGTAALCAAFYISLNRNIGGRYTSILEGMRFVRKNILTDFLFTETGILFFLGSGVMLLTIMMSHRIAGPLFRLERTAKAIGAGDLAQKVRLRDKDQLKDLADQMNEMVDGLNGLVDGIKGAYKILEGDMTLLEERMDSRDCTNESECAAIIRDILESTKAINEKLAEIRT